VRKMGRTSDYHANLILPKKLMEQLEQIEEMGKNRSDSYILLKLTHPKVFGI